MILDCCDKCRDKNIEMFIGCLYPCHLYKTEIAKRIEADFRFKAEISVNGIKVAEYE